jgi:CheY-like chemotaxis protein/anti-sigma regulatory factor (Ser/Thr protein kinase)
MRQLEVEFAPMARAKGLQLKFVTSTRSVRSDRRLLRRLLQNLISNAIKYTPQGRVLIGCRLGQGKLRLDVYDTGLGIPKSKQRAIFHEFHRLDQGAKVARGLGLGLSIVERIARVLDHRVDLQSKPGRGSQFSVTVPLAPALPLSQKKSKSQRVELTQLADLVVLCIDNEPKILDGMATLLGGWGCHVLKAADLKAALATLSDAKALPSGLLVDYHLDAGNGIEAITALRWRFGAELPAILVTADRSPAVREEARARDIQVLAKPLKPAALRALMAQWRVTRLAAAE